MGEDYVDPLACELRESVMAPCGQRKVELHAAFRSEREDWIESMVVAGLGFAFMPQYSVRLSGLLQRPLFDPRVERTVLLTDVRERQRSPGTKLFVSATSGFSVEKPYTLAHLCRRLRRRALIRLRKLLRHVLCMWACKSRCQSV